MIKKGENLTKLFSPESVALVGASANPEKIGNIVIKNIERSGYEGELVLVNPNLPKIGDYKCYPNYKSLEFIPDLAIIATPAEIVLTVLEEIGEKGTKNVVVYAAGFKEAGNNGQEKEEQLKNIAGKYGLRILGPNCLGFFNSHAKLNATFGKINQVGGNIRFAAQSGALATSLFDWAEQLGIGFKEFITLGNKSVLNENDVMEYWAEQTKFNLFRRSKNTDQRLSPYQPFGLYLESISDGGKFVKIGRELSKNNPVFLLKPGKSVEAKTAMRSHTGAMAGDENVLGAALNDAGIIQVNGAEELFDLTRAFAWERAPEGPNVAIISNAGGPGVIATDSVIENDLIIAKITDSKKKKLLKFLPESAGLNNPIDLLGDALPERYSEALKLTLAEKDVHSVLVILTPQAMTKIETTASLITEISKKYKKPIFCSFMGGAKIEVGETILNDAKIPNFRFPERAIRVLSLMWKWRAYQKNIPSAVKTQNPKLKPVSVLKINGFVKSIASERKVITSFETGEIFREAGILVPEYDLVTDLSGAESFVAKHSFPVVLKISCPELSHKTEAGGVIANINSILELTAAVQKMQKKIAELKRKNYEAEILIQKFVPGGIEVIVGYKQDQNFGPVLVVGAGGIFAELMGDIQLRRLPVNKKIIEDLILNSKIGKILNGYRGKEKYAVAKLVDLIMRFSSVVVNTEGIKELEINPVIVTKTDAYAVDGRAVLS